MGIGLHDIILNLMVSLDVITAHEVVLWYWQLTLVIPTTSTCNHSDAFDMVTSQDNEWREVRRVDGGVLML